MISPVLRDYKHDMAIAIRYNRTYSRKAALLFYRARMLGKAYKIVKEINTVRFEYSTC